MATKTDIKELHGAVGIYFNSTVGSGLLGKVCRAKCGLLPCVAKVFNDSIILPDDKSKKSNDRIAEFEKDCKRLLSIRHPSLVQYLGIANGPNIQLPLLFMEVLNKNLTQFLESANEPLPFHMQVNISYDVCLGLAFLHFNSIIHSALSSNNVLVIGEASRAKVADFGLHKYVPAEYLMSKSNSTFPYMAPELLTNQSSFTTKTDCFSVGVLLLQIITRQLPSPAENVKNEDKLSEVERRREDIRLVDLDHQLLPLALDCLEDKGSQRPSSQVLCEQLASIRKEDAYQTSRERYVTSLNELRLELQKKQILLKQRDEQIQENEAKFKKELQTMKEIHIKQLEKFEEDFKKNKEKETSLGEEEGRVKSDSDALTNYKEDLQIAKDEDSFLIVAENEKFSPGVAKNEDSPPEVVKKEILPSETEVGKDEDPCVEVINDKDSHPEVANDDGSPPEDAKNDDSPFDEEKSADSERPGSTWMTDSSNLPSQSPAPEIVLVLSKNVEDEENGSTESECHASRPDKPNELQIPQDKPTVVSSENTQTEIEASNNEDTEKSQVDTSIADSISHQDSNSTLDKSSICDIDSASHESFDDEDDHTPGKDEKWSVRSSAPEAMCALYGTATTDGKTAYFSRHYNIYSYSLSKDKWSQLKPSNYQNFSLVVLEGSIITIGGISRELKRTKNLYGLSNGRWRVRYSSMPNHRVCAAALAMSSHLIVAGGRNKLELDSIDVMDRSTGQWHTLQQSLPERMGHPQMIVCNESIYICKHLSVYSTSIDDLLNPNHMSAGRSTWNKLQELPSHMGEANLVAIAEKIVALGGHNSNDRATGDICSYNDGSWSIQDNMPTPCGDVLSVLLPDNILVIVGGWSDNQFYKTTNVARLKISD